MQYNADPDFVMRYCIRETALSPLVRRMTFSTEHGSGVMCLLELWTGVQVWTIDFHVPQLPIRPTGDYHYLKLNFCTGGRCEVPLPAGYIYIDQGTLSVDVNPPVGVMLCPGGCYQGLELAWIWRCAEGMPLFWTTGLTSAQRRPDWRIGAAVFSPKCLRPGNREPDSSWSTSIRQTWILPLIVF